MGLTGLRTGVQNIYETASKQGGGGKWTPYISWKKDDVKTILFLTKAEDIPKLRIHNFVEIPDDEREKGFRYETFICRKDPAFADESGGFCELCDNIGHEPTERFVALAVELDKIMDGKKVKDVKVRTREYERDGETRVYPVYGLVMQGAKNFFAYFAAFTEQQGIEITDLVFDIARKGDGTDTTYPAFPQIGAPLPDLTIFADQIPTLEEIIARMGSQEKYDEELANVQPGSQKQKSWGGKTSKNVGSGGAQNEMLSKFEQLKSQTPQPPVESYG